MAKTKETKPLSAATWIESTYKQWVENVYRPWYEKHGAVNTNDADDSSNPPKPPPKVP